MTCIADISCAYDGHMETNTTHKPVAIKSRKYANAVEVNCTCGWHDSIHIDQDPRFKTMREAWREIRYMIQDHKDSEQ